MNVLKNRYLIWLIALIFFALSPQNSDFLSEVKRLYVYGFSLTYLERYVYGFYSVLFWIIRVFSIILNVKIAKTRNENSVSIFWITFALMLPSISLIINGFMTIDDKKKLKKQGWIFSFLLILLIVGIYTTGIVNRNKEYSARIEKMNSFMDEYTNENLDTSIIHKLDSIAISLDTTGIEKLTVLANDSVMKNQKQDYVPIGSKLNLFIKYDTNREIQYIIERNLTQPSGSAMSIFDSNGMLLLRDISFYYHTLELLENSKEYYNNGDLVKTKYSRVSSNNYDEDINDYLLDDNRYDFKLYETIDKFNEKYKLER